MRVFEVVIEGTKPILLHNPAGMGQGGAKKSGEKCIPTPEEEAAASCYWTDDKSSLMFPASNLQGAMIGAAGAYKVAKKSIVPFVAGSVEIEPEQIPFGTKQYVIDTRRAVVQRSSVLRSRAKLPAWKLQFQLLVDPDFPVREPGEVLRDILQEAGRRIGIGDFRPQKKGKFGKFQVTKFAEAKNVHR